MNKNIKTLLCALVLLVNAGVIVGVCIYVGSLGNTFENKYIEINGGEGGGGLGDSVIPTLNGYSEVKYDYLSERTPYEGGIEFKEDTFKHYTVDVYSKKNGDVLEAGDIIGTYSSSNVNVESKCIIISSFEDSGEYDITTYVYNNFNIYVDISLEEYNTTDYSIKTDFKIEIDGVVSSLTFKTYDLSYIETNSVVRVFYTSSSIDKIVLENSNYEIFVEKTTSSKVYYVEDNDRINSIGAHRVFVYKDGKYEGILVECVNYYKNIATIECHEYSLYEGLIIYNA